MQAHTEAYTHFNMSIIGGFFGCFAIISFCDVFANAQTTNMIKIINDIARGDFLSFFLRMAGLIVYFAGLSLSVIIPHYSRINLKYLSLIFNTLSVAAIAFMPSNVENSFYTYPLFFSMAFQWTAFPGAFGFASSCIFSTNNSRQFSTSLTEFVFSKEKAMLKKAKFYGLTLLSYHFGALIAVTGSLFIGKNCIFIVLIPITSAFILVSFGKAKKQKA